MLTLELIVRIVIACICGAGIGIERTLRLKEAGIRTHTIVALGSALMMVVSKYGFLDKDVYLGSFDASRIAASVVTGISFLGAGVIFVKGNSIKGLTTAAGIWATSGIGLALGAGMYTVGVVSTVVLIAIQLSLHRFVGGLDSMSMSDISVTVVYSPEAVDRLTEMLAKQGIKIHRCNAIKGDDNTVTLNMTVKSEADLEYADMVNIFEHNENIISFSI